MATISALLGAFLGRKRLTATREEYRVITPICSALEVHGYKNAIQLCNKQIKKQPNDYSVQALKLVALSRASKPLTQLVLTEIEAIVEFIKANANGAGLGDADVLMFLSWVLVGMGRSAEVLDILAKATSKHGDNEDVCVEAFLHYIRVRERKLAQQLAMRMQKTFSKNKEYLWWSITTILLQAKDPNNPSADLLLTLAERQITAHYTTLRDEATAKGTNGATKSITNGSEKKEETTSVVSTKGKEKAGTAPAEVATVATTDSARPAIEFDTPHEFHLITRFLELSVINSELKPSAVTTVNKSALVVPSLPSTDIPLSLKETLLAHFASSEADKWCEKGLGNEIWRRETELKYGSIENGAWETSRKRLTKSLENGDTNWHTMLYLIRSTFSQASRTSKVYFEKDNKEGIPSQPSDEGQGILKEIGTLFRGLADDGEKGKRERGFLLALLEIARESRTRGWEEADALLELVVEYFERFSTKMCAFDDLFPYLEILTAAERTSLAEKMEAAAAGTEDLTLKSLQSSINASKIARFVSPPLTAEAEVETAYSYLKKYFEALPLGANLISTDLQPADDYAYLAGQALVAAWELSKQRVHLESALAILEYAATRSKYKYQIRILAISIARLLGAPSLALAHHYQLNLKSIQFDTLSHVVLGRASTFSISSSNEGSLPNELAMVSKWYKSGETEGAEMPVRAFTFNNYSKVEDFVVFQDRLALSTNKYNVLIEGYRTRVLAGELDQVGAAEAATLLEFMASNSEVALSDNRDFQTLPNLQPSGSSTIWEQVQMGPRANQTWLKAFVAIYGRLLAPSSVATLTVEPQDCLDLTSTEAALLDFSKAAQKTLEDGASDKESEQATLEFFKARTAQFATLVEDPATLPWELLHVAEIALEAYSLLDLAVDRKIVEFTASRVKDHAKLSKQLRTLRTAARELVKSLGAKANNYAKQVAKQRTKTKDSLVPLKRFPLLDDDYLLNFSHALVESRKTMSEGLASAIHRRCSK